MTFAEFLTRSIFAPLGMKKTFVTDRAAAPARHRAFGYSRRDGRFTRTDQSLTSYVRGDGGIYSTLDDLRKWETALTRATLLPRAVLDQSMLPAIATDRPHVSYGWGWYVGKHGGADAVWHDGTTTGFRNHILRLPGQNLTVVLLTNRSDAQPATLAGKLADLYLTQK